jgi:hypothetical protein
MDEVKNVNSNKLQAKSNHLQTTSLCRTLSDPTWASPKFKNSPQKSPTGLCSVLPDIVWLPRTLSNIWIWAQRLVFWESSIYTPPLPTTLFTWPLCSTVVQAHFFHLQRPKSLSPRAFILSSSSRDWVKQGFGFLMWFTFSSSFWLLNLHPPCLLLLELCS